MNLSLLHIHKPRAFFPPAPNPFCSLFVYSENGHNRSKSQNLDFHKRVDHSTAPPKFPKLKPMFSLETLSRTLPTWFSQKGISQISIHAYGFLILLLEARLFKISCINPSSFLELYMVNVKHMQMGVFSSFFSFLFPEKIVF